MKKDLLNITAYSPKVDKFVNLQFFSINEARIKNPTLKNFSIKGFF